MNQVPALSGLRGLTVAVSEPRADGTHDLRLACPHGGQADFLPGPDWWASEPDKALSFRAWAQEMAANFRTAYGCDCGPPE
jgi:hypothetical protein